MLAENAFSRILCTLYARPNARRWEIEPTNKWLIGKIVLVIDEKVCSRKWDGNVRTIRFDIAYIYNRINFDLLVRSHRLHIYEIPFNVFQLMNLDWFKLMKMSIDDWCRHFWKLMNADCMLIGSDTDGWFHALSHRQGILSFAHWYFMTSWKIVNAVPSSEMSSNDCAERVEMRLLFGKLWSATEICLAFVAVLNGILVVHFDILIDPIHFRWAHPGHRIVFTTLNRTQ